MSEPPRQTRLSPTTSAETPKCENFSPPKGAESVTLRVVAHVHAGLAEEHSLDTLLALEDLSADAFRYGDSALRQRFVGEPLIRADYEEALVAAENRFHRTVSPVDADPAAWVALLDAYAFAPAPFASYLPTVGLQRPLRPRIQQTRRRMGSPQ